MGLESATYISSLVSTNPTASDAKSQGDDHIRLIKSTVLATFPNITGAMTSSHTELNILDGATLSTAELNILDGVTASTAEINVLDGITASTTELNYVDGVTSAIQTQLDAKADLSGDSYTGTHDFSGATGVTLPAATIIGSVDATEIGYLNGVTSAIQTQINTKGAHAGQTWTGTHDFTGATTTVATQTNTDNSAKAASTAFVQSVAMNSALPNQTGNSGKYLNTNGTDAFWSAVASGLYYSAKSGTYTATISDDKTVFDCTGTWTFAFNAISSLGNGWFCYIRNSGTGTITLNPDGAETIDGASTLSLLPGHIVMVECDGSALRTVMRISYRLRRTPILGTESASLNAASALEYIDSLAQTIGANAATFVANDVLFVGSTANAGTIYTSTDGVTFTARTTATSLKWVSGAKGAGLPYVILAGVTGASAVNSSTDLVTWSTRALPNAVVWTAVAFASTRYVAVSTTSGATGGAYSTDGVTWSALTIPAGFSGLWYMSSPGLLIAFPTSASTTYYTSVDAGANWVSRTAPVAIGGANDTGSYNVIDGVAYAKASGAKAWYQSTDAVNWTLLGSEPSTGATQLSKVNGHWLIADPTNNCYYTSPDFITWTRRSSTGSAIKSGPISMTQNSVATLAVTATTDVSLVSRTVQGFFG